MKIALIDDDEHFRCGFENLAPIGAEIVAFASSSEALQKAEHLSDCDAILIDVHLKDDTGFGVLDKIKASGNVASAVLFLTEDTSLDTKLLGLRLGVSDFLHKSMCTEEVRLRINNAVKVRQDFNQRRIGNLLLDQDRMTCRLDGTSEDIGMTKIEFQIMRQLFRSPGGILKGDLEHALWKDTITVPNTLNTHLHNLNAKFLSWNHSIRITREGWTQLVPKSN